MRKFFLHFLFWIVFLLMWNQVVYFYISNRTNRIYFSVLDVSLVVIAFYIVYLYIIPDYLRRKKAGILVLSAVLLSVVLAVIYGWIMAEFLHHCVMPIRFNFTWNYTNLQYNRFFIALLGVLAGCFVKLGVDRLEVGRRMEIMEKEKSIAELTYLKAQINPHFLFNSLNSLYTQLDLSPENAKDTLVAIADLLRYQLYECNTDFITVAKELAYLQNYFNLQRIRNDNSRASLIIEGSHQNLSIAPLLLIPYVENAFKYVSDNDEQENLISIRIGFVEDELIFCCSNTFELVNEGQTAGSNKGIGLQNVRKRLELIYAQKFRLKEGIDDGLYVVNLRLKLK